jgi:DNA gyrase subunit A
VKAISQFGKIIRIDTKSIRAAGHSNQEVNLLNLEADDKVAAAVVIQPDESKSEPETGTRLQPGINLGIFYIDFWRF